MNNALLALSVAFIPLVAVWLALFLPYIKFSKNVIAIVQAAASGFLLGSIAIDLMPRVLHKEVAFSYIVSFIIGAVLMFAIQRGDGGCCPSVVSKKPLKSFLFPFMVEFFITSVLIGIASSTSTALLIMIAVSFGLCNFVCGLSVASRLTALNIFKTKRALIAVMLTVTFPVVALLSAMVAAYIPIIWLNDLLSFAVAILLYLVLAELLPEALAGNKRLALMVLFGGFSFIFLLLLCLQIL